MAKTDGGAVTEILLRRYCCGDIVAEVLLSVVVEYKIKQSWDAGRKMVTKLATLALTLALNKKGSPFIRGRP